ncbi:hypothetical protein MAR_003300 [Mya arenaria]|uniref:Sushi domain-containing protein n=1 Tax=Mya arenaria TaxID=6604 RepID=A0ABY7G721_MYAAR|nr:hypothetical protein MAR_003300 [Mya arenaria]
MATNGGWKAVNVSVALTCTNVPCLEFVLSKHPSGNVNHDYETVSTTNESACFLACFDIPYCRTFRYSSGTTTYGSFVTYTCVSGYIPTGDDRFTCADTGQWTGNGFSCEGCGFPPNVSSATYTLTSGTNYDSVANYVCVTGRSDNDN